MIEIYVNPDWSFWMAGPDLAAVFGTDYSVTDFEEAVVFVVTPDKAPKGAES